LPALVLAAGFEAPDLESHGYVEVTDPTYVPTIVDYGAEALVTDGVIGEQMATALRAECRRRVEAGSFYAHIAYASLLATA
jgi:hypothetical protein